MERLRSLIKEVLSTPPKKKDCNCGCNTCENVGNPGVLINESVAPKEILSENLQYHVQNKLPLTENTFRYGSKSFLNLWSEARYLYLREIIHVNEDDKEILLETNLGEYGIYEGQKVPLDMPMLEEKEGVPHYTKDGKEWKGKTHKMDDGSLMSGNPHDVEGSGPNGESEKLYHKEDLKESRGFMKGELRLKAQDIINFLGIKASEENINDIVDRLINAINAHHAGTVLEAEKKKNPPLGKPKRGGSKAYYVYVKDPKTKRIKKVSFGSGGLKAKINNPKARQAFAKRHRCSEKTDKTKASYWSCRIPRYSKLLGFKTTFTGYW